MNYTISKLWQHHRKDRAQAVYACLRAALDQTSGKMAVPVFFRADDVAVPGRQFEDLIRVFSRHRVPLSMAVVPAWLTRSRWEAIQHICRSGSDLWCFYQHGWRHKNHEPTGKKQEFGTARASEAIRHDLSQGRDRLASLMGSAFYPAFTPPWNRCSKQTLNTLTAMEIRTISRSRGARPAVPAGMKDFQVNVDLHTRKDTSAAKGWENLLTDLASAVAGGFCGIMIHHQRMNRHALAFLDNLLGRMRAMDRFYFYHLKELAEGRHEA